MARSNSNEVSVRREDPPGRPPDRPPILVQGDRRTTARPAAWSTRSAEAARSEAGCLKMLGRWWKFGRAPRA